MRESESTRVLPPASPLLTTLTAARYVRAHPATLGEWRRTRRGPPYVRVGRRVFYRQVDLDEWIKTRTFSSREEEATETPLSTGRAFA